MCYWSLIKALIIFSTFYISFENLKKQWMCLSKLFGWLRTASWLERWSSEGICLAPEVQKRLFKPQGPQKSKSLLKICANFQKGLPVPSPVCYWAPAPCLHLNCAPWWTHPDLSSLTNFHQKLTQHWNIGGKKKKPKKTLSRTLQIRLKSWEWITASSAQLKITSQTSLYSEAPLSLTQAQPRQRLSGMVQFWALVPPQDDWTRAFLRHFQHMRKII